MHFEHGTTRIVLLTENYAFKFPTFVEWRLFLTGLLGNMQEAKFSSLSDKFCPVIFSMRGGWLVVMPRAEPITPEEFSVLTEDWLHEENLELPVEMKMSSFGKLGKRLVAIDYG